MKAKDTEVATGLEVRVYRGEEFLGVSAEISTGRWETHPAPVESNPWTYHANVDEAVKSLVRCNDVYRHQDFHLADDAGECDDKYIQQDS